MEENATKTAEEATPDELSGDWIRGQLLDAPKLVPKPPATESEQTGSLQTDTSNEDEADANSVNELASALLHATTRPLQALERDWSTQLQTFQSAVNERFGAVEQTAEKLEHVEVAIASIRQTLRGTEDRTQRIESQSTDFLDQIGSLETTITERLQAITTAIDEIRRGMAMQEESLRELQLSEARRAEAVQKLAEIFSGVQDTLGLLATTSNSATGEPHSG